MQSQNRLLDDLARVASGALGVAAGMREEVEARLRDQFERVLAHMELVNREEFEAVRAMAVKAREEQEALGQRVAALEAALLTARESVRESKSESPGESTGESGAAAKPAKKASAKPRKTARRTAKPAAEPEPGEGPET